MPSQAILEQFKDSPGTFLKYNAVKWYGSYPADQSVIRVAMADGETIWGPGTRGRRRTSFWKRKVSTPFYCLLQVRDDSAAWNLVRGDNTPTFDAVWSGFRQGQAVDAVLMPHGGPGIMLTPTLTGCSVVCSSNSEGFVNARFSHYNLMNRGADYTLEKATMEAIAKAAYGDRKHRVLAKEQYDAKAKHTGQCEVTVVGHRRIGRWEFWAQYLEDKQSGWQIRNVHKIV